MFRFRSRLNVLSVPFSIFSGLLFQNVVCDTGSIETLRSISWEQAENVRNLFSTPCYVYSQRLLEENAQRLLEFPSPYGLTVRYAMKASPNRNILRIFNDKNLSFDASSGFEAWRAIQAGIQPSKISLSTQDLPLDFDVLIRMGIHVNACSIHQLILIASKCPNSRIGIRVNPGLGSGSSNKTNVGGPNASFGIWKDDVAACLVIAKESNLTIDTIHTHIGSGNDPAVWETASKLSLAIARQVPSVTQLNLGGGFKVSRMKDEKEADLQAIGQSLSRSITAFFVETGRKLHLEIEPGTRLVANAGCLVTTVQDTASTGKDGRDFLKLDAGMTEIIRPSLYGSQHGIIIQPKNSSNLKKYVIVGHCCESGDLLSPLPGQGDVVSDRLMNQASIGDLCVIESTGAYCSSMSCKNYNSFPEAPEVLIELDGSIKLIRKRQTLSQVVENEL